MIYAISDIHGRLDAFQEALAHVDLSGDNQLILLGDYIDYGKQSGGVLRYIRALQAQHGAEKVVALRGNHEEAFLEWLDTYTGPGAGKPDEYGMLPWNEWLEYDPDFGTFQTLVSPQQWAFFQQVLPTLSQDDKNLTAARMILEHDPELIAWLRGLRYFYETPRQIFVHAGIDEEAGDWWPWGTTESIFVGKYPAAKGSFYKDIIAGHVSASRLAGDPSYHGVYFDGQSHYYIDGDSQLNVLAWDEENGYRQWNGKWNKEIRTERKPSV